MDDSNSERAVLRDLDDIQNLLIYMLSRKYNPPWLRDGVGGFLTLQGHI